MVDISGWKEFKLSEIGFSNYHGVRQTKANREEGDIPLLTAGKENQGVASYISNAPMIYEDAITVDMFGNSFYHKGKCTGDDNIYFFINDDVSDNVKMFIVAILNADNTKKYAYKTQFRQSQADALSVSLPAASDGQPDWDYMEQYMKQIMEKAERSIARLSKADDAKKRIDVSGWGEFKIEDIFEVIKGTRLTKADMKDGVIRFVGSSAMNNGETHRISNNEHLHPANTITVCYNGSVGETFYQDEEFWASDDVNVLYPKFDMTRYIAFFICPIIRLVGQKYAFVNKWKQEDMKADIIKLPITSIGDPDWQYMEDYMRGMMDKSEQIISALQIGA